MFLSKPINSNLSLSNVNSNLFLGDKMKIRKEYTFPLGLVHDMINGYTLFFIAIK